MSTLDAHEQRPEAPLTSSASDPGRLNLLLDVVLRVASSGDRVSLVSEFASQLSWVMDFEQCWFGLVEQEGSISYHRSMNRATDAPASISSPDRELIKQVLQDSTIRRDESAAESIALCLPLCVGERTIGGMLLRSGHARNFDRNDIRFAQAATAFLSLALDRLGRIEALDSARQVQQHNEELVRTKSALEQLNADLARSNKDLDEFAYVASHDLRSPLAAIKDLAKWVQEDNQDSLPEKSRKHLSQMLQRVGRLERLLEDLLQYSRAGRRHWQIERVDTNNMVREIVTLLNPPPPINVTVAPGMPMFATARTPLEMVFRNLIGNAIKHRERDELQIEIQCRANGQFYEFVVRDNGGGIDPQFHAQIFKLFETLRSRDEVEASGMGLAIIKRTVESYGGTVSVESAVGHGATFRFTWPKAIETASNLSESQSDSTPQSHRS